MAAKSLIEQPDQIIHQPVRLRIMAALRALSKGESMDFVQMRAVVKATDGNLGMHITTLRTAGYVAVDKSFVRNVPRTRVQLTNQGRRAFEAYIAFLNGILDADEVPP